MSDGNIQVCSPIRKKITTVFLNWVHADIPTEQLVEPFRAFGKVLSLDKVMHVLPGFEHIATTRRIMKIELHNKVSITDIPFFMNVWKMRISIFVPGRPPLCYRCSKTGHIRAKCTEPHCTECNRFGHVKEDCTKNPKSYAEASSLPKTDTNEELEECQSVTLKPSSVVVMTPPPLPTPTLQSDTSKNEPKEQNPTQQINVNENPKMIPQQNTNEIQSSISNKNSDFHQSNGENKRSKRTNSIKNSNSNNKRKSPPLFTPDPTERITKVFKP